MTTRRARAMLIGIEYPNHDADKQLRAGRNDALAFWKVCRRLGFSHENIHVFTSPVLAMQDLIWAEQELGDEIPEYANKSADDIETNVKSWFPPGGDKPKVLLAEATGTNIRHGLSWLSKQIEGENKQAVDRLLTYSGHGTKINKNGAPQLALCPNDFVVGQTDSFIGIDEFKEKLHGVDDNLTVVLDCCFAQSSAAPRSAHRVATLSQLETDKPLAIDVSGLGARVFCASGANESSHQALLGGYWYGAFTWAMTVALEQWRICREHKPHSTISHGELLSRTRQLLEALSFKQQPVLLHSDKLANAPVFGHVETEESVPAPNEARRGGQIDPSCKDGGGYYAEYLFYEGEDARNWNARVIATSPIFSDSRYSRNGMEANKEYWRINGNSFVTSKLGDMTVKKVKCGHAADIPSFSASEASFSCDVEASWTKNGNDLTYHESNHRGFNIDISKDASGNWKGTMKFFLQADDTALFHEIDDEGTNWYRIRTRAPGQKCEIQLG